MTAVFVFGCWVARFAKRGDIGGIVRAPAHVPDAFPDAQPLGTRVTQMDGRTTRLDAFYVASSVLVSSERFIELLEKTGARISRHQIGSVRIIRYAGRRGAESYAIFSPGPRGKGCTIQIARPEARGKRGRLPPKSHATDVPTPRGSKTLFQTSSGPQRATTLLLLETTMGPEQTASYYRRAMKPRGWQENRQESILLSRRGGGRFMAFEKRGGKCIIEIAEDPQGRTGVTIIRFPAARLVPNAKQKPGR